MCTVSGQSGSFPVTIAKSSDNTLLWILIYPPRHAVAAEFSDVKIRLHRLLNVSDN